MKENKLIESEGEKLRHICILYIQRDLKIQSQRNTKIDRMRERERYKKTRKRLRYYRNYL